MTAVDRSAETALDRALADLLGELEPLSPSCSSANSRPISVTRPAPGELADAFIHRFNVQPVADGPLTGRTVGVKDTIAISGVPRTRGRRTGWDAPSSSATVVNRVLCAGGRIVGTLNMDAWSASATGEGSEFGVARNPCAPDRLPGGSSSGAGAALGAHLVDDALGTDTAGSARIPASWCGVVALKPTSGLVPLDGVVGLEPTLDAVCPMARSVDECRVLFDVVADQATRPRVARSAAIVRTDADPACLEALERAADVLRERAVPVTQIDVAGWQDAWRVELAILTCSVPYLLATQWQGRWSADDVPAPLPADAPPRLVELWIRALEVLGHRANEIYHGAQAARVALREAVDRALVNVDVLLTPTTPTTAPRRKPASGAGLLASLSGGETPVVTSTLTCQANLTGVPALAVPFGRDDNDLPCSVQLHAARGDEAVLFGTARLLEEANELD